jgi:predicted MFS family arabinose efflux permease
MIGGAFLLATAVRALLGGALVDRRGFRWTITVANLASSVARALLPVLCYTVGLTFWQVLALIFLSGPGYTGRQSIIPALAGRADMLIELADSAMHAIRQFSLLLGSPLAGFLIAAFGAITVPWVATATLVVSPLSWRFRWHPIPSEPSSLATCWRF